MKSTKLTSRARELRKNMTPQEQKLWNLFLRRHPFHFRRQQPFGPYIADFYCAAAKLIIELDGSGHFHPDGLEYDRWRDAFMTGQGFRVLRFTNAQIDNEFAAVCTEINLALSDPLSQLR